MNKVELIEKIVETTGSTKKEVDQTISTMIDVIQQSLKNGEKVAIAGFGTFDVSSRKEREGRNPATGETIKIAASKSPKFKPGKSFKEMLN